MIDRGVILSEEERIDILNWICDNYYREFTELNGKRLHYFYKGYDGHPLFERLRHRIMKREGLEGYSAPDVFDDDTFMDIIACILPGGELHPHKDTNHHNLIHVRYNVILLQSDESPKTYYGGHPVNVKQGHYTLCRSGLDYHWIERNTSMIPRISISFGFLLSLDQLDERIQMPPETAESRALLTQAKENLKKFQMENRFVTPDYILGNRPASENKLKQINEYRMRLAKDSNLRSS